MKLKQTKAVLGAFILNFWDAEDSGVWDENKSLLKWVEKSDPLTMWVSQSWNSHLH